MQSYNLHMQPAWIADCVASVSAWAGQHGYEHRTLDDVFFERYVPAWYLAKVDGRLPIAADFGRLAWIAEVHRDENYDVVLWLDADTLIVAPDLLTIELTGDHQFGREAWLQEVDGRLRVYRSVHNAYCAFQAGSPVLSFLLFAIERMMRRVDSAHIAPQFVGPKLLTHLHNTVGFQLEPRFGAISPDLARAVREDDAAVLARWRQEREAPLLAANLSASVVDPQGDAGARLVAELTQLEDGL
ncbi:MAG: hypothetical protein AAF513_06630 [Pseudomonadota bacterium]